MTEQIFFPSYSSAALTRNQGCTPKRKAQGATKHLPCMNPNSVKLINNLKSKLWLWNTFQHYLFKAEMFPFIMKRYSSSLNFAWGKFQSSGNFARNGAPKVIMKLKQHTKYEKYDYVLFMTVKQSWEWYLFCLSMAQQTVLSVVQAEQIKCGTFYQSQFC